MNELKQIRERFLAHARQHFLANDACQQTTPNAAQGEGGQACSNAHDGSGGRNLG